MPVSLAPFSTNLVSLTLIPSADVGVGTAVEYKCQLSQAELTSAEGTAGTTFDSFCDSFVGPSGKATYTLTLAGFQAYADVEDLSNLLFDHEGENLTYVLHPNSSDPISITNPAFTGEIVAAPGNIGGTANNWAVFSVALKCVGRPTKVTVPGP